MPARVTTPVVLGLRDSIDPPPGPHQPLDMRRRRTSGEIEQAHFVCRGSDAGEGADLRVRERPAAHFGAQVRQLGQGAGHAHLLARRSHG